MKSFIVISFLLLIASVLWAAETVGPYMCTATDNGKLIAGPYSCGVSSDGKATIATVTISVPKVSPLNTNTYRIVLNLTSTSKGKVAMVPAGSVPAGTACDPLQKLTLSGVEYFRFDRDTPGLVWSGNNQPPVIWAQCS